MNTRLAARLATLAAAWLVASACSSPPPPVRASPIWGTRVSLQIPSGFWVADGHLGIANASGASVLVTEVERPENEMRAETSEEAVATRGMRWLETETIEVGGAARPLVHVEHAVDGEVLRRWILVLGDAETSSVLVASVPIEGDHPPHSVLERVLKTAERDPERSIGTFEGLGFRLGPTDVLVIEDRNANAVSLAEPDDESPGRLIAVASPAPAGLEADTLEAFSAQRLAETPGVEGLSYLSSRAVVVDGMPAHEIVARCVESAAPKPGVPNSETAPAASRHGMVLFQTIALGVDRYYLVQGTSGLDDADRLVAEFRQIAGGLQRSD